MEALTEQIRGRIRHEPRVGIVCGSGLGGLADVVEDKQMIKYSELEGMPVSTGQWLTTQRGGGVNEASFMYPDSKIRKLTYISFRICS